MSTLDGFMRPGGAWDGPFGEALWDALAHTHAAAAGAFGAYRIVREIGRGGMSVVYLARRATGDFEQRVAIKVLKRGIDADELIPRFEQERRILAALQHPGIARLLDGGAAEDRPFIVMELVEGVAIDRYCGERQLSVRERLRLFAQVADAVGYAHRHLVVHRDLKPSNVLVTPDGRAKLLDFGIAKLLDPDAFPGPVPPTRVSLRVMTPEYASPEQLRGEMVTTASDVYQLGLLLRELLTGQREARQGASDVPGAGAAAAGRAGSSAAPNVLRGDLLAITAMALREEPEARYASADRLSEDIARYLASAPIRARPATWSYRARRFAARHRAAVAAALAIVALTIGYGALALRQQAAIAAERDRARVEAAKATEVTRFLVNLFTLADPTKSGGEAITARQLLDVGAVHAGQTLAAQPDVLAAMLKALGESYAGLGLGTRAEPLLRRALGLVRTQQASAAADGSRDADRLDAELSATLASLGQLLHEAGKRDEAAALFGEALARRRARLGPSHPDVAASLRQVALVKLDAGDRDGAEALVREALAMRKRWLTADDPAIAQSLHDLGRVLHADGRAAEAAVPYRDALRIRRARLGTGDPDTTDTENALGLLLLDAGDHASALQLLRQALAANSARLGETHPYVATNVNNVALALKAQGKLDDAEPLFRRSVDLLRQAYGPRHPRVAIGLFNLATLLEERRDYAAAEPIYREVLAIDREALGDDHVEVAIDRARLARLLGLAGDRAAADALFRQAVRQLRAALPAGHPRLTTALVGYGELLIDLKRPGEALPMLREAVGIRERAHGASDARTRRAQASLERATVMASSGK